MAASFVHLRVHSEYSLVDGLVRVKPLVKQVAEQGMPAVALTDQSNLFALVRFYQAALAAGVKPIAGVDAWIRNPDDVNTPYRLVLLVQNQVGYQNLTRLVSRSYREGQHLGRPLMEREWLMGNTEGLIALSAGRHGDVGRALLAENSSQAKHLLKGWLELFGDRYYLELHRTGRADEERCLHQSVALATEFGVPVVATNDTHFLQQSDFDAHEVRVCIHEGRTIDDPRRPKNYSDQQYLRSPEEMEALFSDIPEALQNSLEIAKRCTIELTLGKNFLPDFPIPEGMTIEEFLEAESRKGLDWRLNHIFDTGSAEFAEQRKIYDERLQVELDVINSMGFPGYFLIVADFIQWAKDNDIPVGPGRGSGAGSLVAYALKITDLDPIEHELLFERFLNPERVSMPDFDVDFCMDKRDQVIDYVAHRYGRDSVSQIITYGSMAAKAVVRDVGRVLGHPYGFTDRVAKMIPFEIGMTLDKALNESDDLKHSYQTDEEVGELIDMAKKLEGCARNAGKHAGGVVISPGLLTDFTPLYCEANGEGLVTQFDKDDVEKVGLVKFDFLGLRTLTIVDWALKAVNGERVKQNLEPLDINAIAMDDKGSFKLLKSAETTAVFQLESRGMKELIKKLQPDCFDDITALVALFRPGPLQSGMVDDFINRKHGRAEVAYPHPDLEPILKPTYGVILYQEQVMQIAQVLAGYSLGGADLLRRAMGKKKPEEMAKQGEIFRKGAVERGVEEATATYIFDLMEKFAGYGFNKSHSAAYALVSYQTMWLKAHYPAAFMAAVCSADMDNTDKVVPLIEECRRMQLKVEAPQVNLSHYKFTAIDEQTVVYGLGAIKGVGESAIESVIQERESHGVFEDIFEFCRRIDLRKVNRRVLESLIRAGALDGLGANRATLMLQLPLALKLAEQHHAMEAVGQNDLFGMGEPQPAEASHTQVIPKDVEEWEEEQRLQGEKETLGLYLTGHPIDRYLGELDSICSSRIGDLSLDGAPAGGQRRRGVPVVVSGLVVTASHRQTQRGRMGTLLLDDRSGRIECTLFNENYEQHRDLISADKILVVSGMLNYDEFRGGLSIRADNLLTIEQARSHYARMLNIHMRTDQLEPGLLCESLEQTLSPYLGGTTGVRLHYRNAEASGDIQLGKDWRVNPTDELLKRLEQLFGVGSVSVGYRHSAGQAAFGKQQPPAANRQRPASGG
ncbi:MAG: DNA polymerase III subunit alpha [Candidatus Thiodiazotropha lotti]|uniref:DNA polymerase III subunit alpha n=1 Tax=Candidatus Thiodiazotropha endoloripes TaxID=1818881 RepID=UPI0009F3DA69|nr:DNA polymerase III subunit alpha [Candidatus Thiodiazotropha endoloripes]MCG7901834.1 DNA polymerase III subunit alpha [Candidatus Thiodiazotropha weberae]MCG7998783.1 DNA polymerase III subunit alpha [Candidatus Thiodiazotropha lotti]MCW4190550.1 DNA polymerase III subunit alpha [Candidatus Thiodiazotropha weberae]